MSLWASKARFLQASRVASKEPNKGGSVAGEVGDITATLPAEA